MVFLRNVTKRPPREPSIDDLAIVYNAFMVSSYAHVDRDRFLNDPEQQFRHAAFGVGALDFLAELNGLDASGALALAQRHASGFLGLPPKDVSETALLNSEIRAAKEALSPMAEGRFAILLWLKGDESATHILSEVIEGKYSRL